jgi:hypothetical protein
MLRNCDVCQTSYEAKRPNAKFCSARCRQRARRAPDSADLASVVVLDFVVAPIEGSLVAATLAELESAEMATSSLGQLALILARRLESPSLDTGSSTAALVREHRATLIAAIESGRVAEDPLDQLAQQRRQRIANG